MKILPNYSKIGAKLHSIWAVVASRTVCAPVLSMILVFFLLATLSVSAATKTWNGGTGTGLNWTTGSNWSGGTNPVAGDDIIFNTAGAITFSTMPNNISYNSLTISQGTVTIAHNKAITLTLGGNAGTDFTVANNASLIIGTNVNITLANNATADISGTLTINTGRTFNIDGNSVITTVNGSIINNGNVTSNASNKLLFNSGSVFEFANNNANIPIATWDVNSTCNITGYTNPSANPPNYQTYFAQNFGNFTWNCTGQTVSISLGGVLKTINGNYTMTSTGTGSLSFGITGIGNIFIGKNFTQTGGYLYGSGYSTAAAGATRTIDITGNFSLSGGTFDLSSTNVAANITTLNIGSNFSHTAGTITETGSSTGSNIRFVASASPHLYTSGGIISNTVNFIVNSDATLQMGTAAFPAIINGSNGAFTLQSGATLGVTHSAGISATGTSTGNIQVTGARSYSSGNINYMGNVAQATGNGLTAAANVSITNTVGITFTVQAAVSGNISMATGTTANLGTGFTHTASSLTLGSTNEPINNTYGGNSSSASQKRPVFFPNTATGIISLGNCVTGTWTGATSTDWHTGSNWCSGTVPTASDNVVIISGTNEPIISAAAVCNNITINPGATVTLSGTNTLTVSGNFNNNGSFTTNAGTLTVAGTYTNGTSFYLNTGTLVLNNSSTSAFTNNGTFTAGTGTVNFNAGAQTAVTPSQTLFYNVIIGGTGLKTINAANFVVMGTLSMEATGSISALPTYGTQATLQYNKPAAFTASVEWPATFSPAGGVVVKNTGVITLNQNKTFSNAPLTVFDGATLAISTFTIANPNALNLRCGGASAGATITGTGLLTLGGDVFVTDANNGTAGATVSCPIALTAATSRTLDVEDDGTTAADLTLSGIISTTGSLIKEGAGTLTLSNSNTFTGGVTLNAGTININNASALGTVAGTFTINGGSIDNTTGGSITTNNYPLSLNNDFSYVGSQSRTLNLGTGAVALNDDLQITVSAGTLTIGGIINDNTKSITKSGTGTLSFGSNAVTLNNFTVNAGTLVSTSASLNLTGNFTNNATFTHNSGTVTFNGTGAQTINSGGSSFNNFTITNTGGTCTASTNDITVAGTFTTNAGTTLDMATNALAVNTVSHAGTLLTQNISAAPLTTGKTWGGTVNYNGSSAQTAMSGTYNNLTISSNGGATASGDITVNGILNLAAANASATKGALEMVTNYGNYPRTNGTNQYVSITSYTLTMGISSATTGQGDVTGKIYRSSVSANTAYTFGNQYTTFAYTVAPTNVTVIVTIGTAYGDGSTWGNTAAVKRSYEMVPTGGTNAQVTMNLHYLESELNGNTEDQLTTGDFDVDEDGGYEDGAPLGDEHGRSSYDYTNNYIGLNGVPISYFIRNESHKWYTIFNLHNFSTGHTIWDGSESSVWLTDLNWSNGIPGPKMTAIIPDAASTPNDPILLAANDTLGGLQILAGGYLNFNSQLLIIHPATYGNGLEDQSGISNYTGSTIVFSNTGWSTPVMGIPHFDNLTINTGASATASLNSHIYIAGTLTKNGGFDASTFDNTVEYNGAAAQIVVSPDGGSYYSLVLNGSNTKTLPATLSTSHDFTMTGSAAASGTTLNVGGNFTNNSSGSFSVSTLNLNGTTSQTLGGTHSTTFTNLTMNNAAGATLGIGETVNGTLTLTSGLITTGSNLLTIACTTGSISGASTSSYINGKLARVYCATGSQDFPIGKGGNYRPLALAYTALTGTSTVTAEQFETTITGTLPSAVIPQQGRHWVVTQTGGSAFNYDITVNGTPFTPGNGNPIILKGDGSTINALPATYSNPDFTTTGLTSFSTFAVASSCTAPTIKTQPAFPAVLCDGTGTTELSVAINEQFSVTYQWQVDDGNGWADVPAGIPYSGETSATLTISNPPYSMNGYAFRVIITRDCGGTVTSDEDNILTITPIPSITINENPWVCSGVTTADLYYSATYGSPDQYTIDWDATANAAGFMDVSYTNLSSILIALAVPSGAAPATYSGTLTVKNSTSDCQSTGYAISVTIGTLPQGSISGNTICNGETGQLTWTATAGTGPFTVVYNDGTSDRTQTNVTSGTAFNVFTNPVTSTTTYTLISVTDANTCQRTSGCTQDSATVTVNALPTCAITGPDGPLCPLSTNNTYSAPADMTNYAWSISGNGSIPGATNQQNVSVTAGSNCNQSFTLTLTITDANNCQSACQKEVNVNDT